MCARQPFSRTQTTIELSTPPLPIRHWCDSGPVCSTAGCCTLAVLIYNIHTTLQRESQLHIIISLSRKWFSPLFSSIYGFAYFIFAFILVLVAFGRFMIPWIVTVGLITSSSKVANSPDYSSLEDFKSFLFEFYNVKYIFKPIQTLIWTSEKTRYTNICIYI